MFLNTVKTAKTEAWNLVCKLNIITSPNIVNCSEFSLSNPNTCLFRIKGVRFRQDSMYIIDTAYFNQSFTYLQQLFILKQKCISVEKIKRALAVMVFNATFNNISAISWKSVLLVEETAASHWQPLSHNVVSSTPRH